jgi:hypothetical protein
MKEFVFIFRGGMGDMSKATPEQMQAAGKAWQDWFTKLGAGDNLKDWGAALMPGGKHVVAKVGNPADNPYTKKKDVISGYSVVKAKSLAEASKLAKGCPIYQAAGSVEVREVMPMNM